jgi:flagellar basal-body rod modification protein FlgD
MALLSGVNSTPSTDPTSQAAQSKQKLDEELNRFLTLLITQLENQDPLDPMDASSSPASNSRFLQTPTWKNC